MENVCGDELCQCKWCQPSKKHPGKWLVNEFAMAMFCKELADSSGPFNDPQIIHTVANALLKRLQEDG